MLKKPQRFRRCELAQYLQQEKLCMLSSLRKLELKLATAVRHAAEEITGLKPGDRITVDRGLRHAG
jgi:hypothetical protein